MKTILLLSLIVTSFALTPSYAYMPQDTVIYSDKNCTCPIVTLPATYFVAVVDYESNLVTYSDISGYVKDAQLVDYEPVTKFANESFVVQNDGLNANLREKPSLNSPVIAVMEDGYRGYYYGDIEGDALIPEVGNLWRYVRYKDGAKGYVYCTQVKVTKPSQNIIEKMTNKEDEAEAPSFIKTDYILVLLLTVPSVLVVYLIFKDKPTQN